MPPRLPPPPQVSKPGTTPNPPKLGESESSKPMPEPDAWLVGELEAFAGASEKSGAKPTSESSGASKPLEPKAASEASGAKRSPSEASGSRKPVIGSEPGVMPAKPTRSATAALVGIGDDLIANASAEDKPLFTAIVAKAEAKSAAGEPDVFDELGLAKTPAVITGQTQSAMDTTSAAHADEANAGAPPKKTDEGFPIPPPRPAAPRKTSPNDVVVKPSSPSTTASRGAKPMSRWTPHVLLGTLGLASIVAIAFRCSGTTTNTAQADTGKNAPIAAKLGDDERGRESAGAGGGSANAGGGNDAVDGEGAAAGGAAGQNDDDVEVDGEAQGDRAADGGNADAADEQAGAAGENAPSEDAAKADAAKADDANADDANADDAQAAGEPAKDDAAAQASKTGAAKDTTPASTSHKSKSRTSPTPIAPSTPSPESTMTAEELLELARKAWAAGNSRDTYKYANKSRYKKPSTEATELATLSACKLKLEKSAKSSFDGLSGDKRRKVRQKCRDWGVWVGL